MKKNDWLVLGAAAAAGYYFLIYKKQNQPTGDILGGITGAIDGAVKGFQAAVPNLANLGAQGAGGIFGSAYSAVVPKPILGQTSASQAQGFSDAFNKIVGGGVQIAVPNNAGTAININPQIGGFGPVLSGGAALAQGAVTSAAINSGIGVASLAPWAGGGVATSYSALSAFASGNNPAQSIPAQVSTAAASIASRLATGRM